MKLIFWRGCALCALALLLWGCAVPQISVDARTFLNLSVEFLDRYDLPQTDVDGLSLGGLSALAYDRQSGRYWALSDAKRSPRAFSLNVELDESGDLPLFQSIAAERAVVLNAPQTSDGQPITLDPEGLAIAPDQQWFVASEGLGPQNPPLLGRVSNQGEGFRTIPIPTRYQPTTVPTESLSSSSQDLDPATMVERTQGIYPNLGFESLALNPEGDRLFTATEAPLVQDTNPDSSEPSTGIRFLHYWVGVGAPYLVAEHLYPLEPPPVGMLLNGLSEILALDSGGHFLSLERAVNPINRTYGVSLFQSAIAEASDTLSVDRLSGDLSRITPIQKKRLLDLSTLGIPLGNLEGMTFGPNFEDGSRSLILVSDNDLSDQISTQFLLFRVTQLKQQVG